MESIEESLIQTDVPLSSFTTLQCGGPAKFLMEANTEEDVVRALSWARSRSLPVFVLGGGSNVVISNNGFPGLVLRMGIRGIEATSEADGSVSAAVGAGMNLDAFVLYCVERGWQGIECLSGIPGSVGAVPIQNVGAYGQEVSESIVSVSVIHRQSLDRRVIPGSECRFAYRTSRFKGADYDAFVVTRVQFRLARDGSPTIRYPELEREVQAAEEARQSTRSLAIVRECVLALRRRKSMVIDPADPNTRSVGSFFLNPIVDRAVLARVQNIAGQRTGNVPNFPVGEQQVKLSAAWLVEQAGFAKGFRFKGAGVSTNHSLALINRGSGAQDILELAGKIEAAVESTFGVRLRREPVVLE